MRGFREFLTRIGGMNVGGPPGGTPGFTAGGTPAATRVGFMHIAVLRVGIVTRLPRACGVHRAGWEGLRAWDEGLP